MEQIMAFISEIPTFFYYIGGLVVLVLLYQRYDENNRYNQKSGPAPEATTKIVSVGLATGEPKEETTTAVEVQMNQQMVDFLKNYDPAKSTWANWALKKFFPEEIMEELSDAVRSGELKTDMKIKIQGGDWQIIDQ